MWYTYILYVVYKFSSVLLLRIDGPTFVNLFRNKEDLLRRIPPLYTQLAVQYIHTCVEMYTYDTLDI